ncbi:MAG: hypothetical protein WB783_03865 [Arenicellales bacterium]
MSRDDENKTQSGQDVTSRPINEARRRLAGIIGGAGGALASGWTKPMVDSVILPAHAVTSGSTEQNPPKVTTDSASGGYFYDFSAQGTVVSEGSAPVTERGFVLSTSPTPTLADGKVTAGSGPGTFSVTGAPTPGNISGIVYVRAYAINSVGAAYGDQIMIDVGVCLAEGTSVTLFDGTTRLIEDIDYDDELLVWNFDQGRFDKARPLYIMEPNVASRYNLLHFGNGSHLRTIIQHRIFNKQAGRFSYPMTEETPLGTVTFTSACTEAVLVEKEVVTEPVRFYNVITDFHMNLFANGILTSIGYNNLYPIRDMKFVKDNRRSIAFEEYEGISAAFYRGLRLAEQIDIPIQDTINYIQRRAVRGKPRTGRVSPVTQEVRSVAAYDGRLLAGSRRRRFRLQ